MKKGCAFATAFVLAALLLVGCRDNGSDTEKKAATSAATQMTPIPSPNITLPSDNDMPDTGDIAKRPSHRPHR